MSNRDRIERMQEEALAKEKEKASAPPKEPKPKARKGAAPVAAGRMKIVWAVCAVNGSIVRTFPYPQKASAEAEVARLTEEKQTPHHLRAEKVPFESV
jgi:hypothetical protein